MGHYFDADPAVASQRRTVSLTLPDLTLQLATDRGVFARDAVDPGTKLLLLEAPPPPPTGDLLDLGCGYGPIAVTLARRSPGSTVWALDINRRALALTAANAEAAGATNVRVAEPDDVPEDLALDLIWSNPPVRIGKADMQAILTRWLRRLSPAGRAVLVVHKHLGADSLTRWLESSGWPTSRLASRMGYRLLQVDPHAGAAGAGT
ncbi:MAG TPA: methyltransferase [Acidimicrobiales bacterium]|nr:methyltransferase [Acidimicrobiales bacterium]